MRRVLSLLLGLVLALLTGCFTCEAPFYLDAQVKQDARIEGLYRNEATGNSDGTSWSITRSNDFPGKYDVLINDGPETAKLTGTLFLLDKTLFLDLYPRSAPGARGGSGPGTVSELIRAFMYEPRHVVWKVELSDTATKYWFPAGNGVIAALRKAPELKGKPAKEPTIIPLPPSTSEAQKYLRKFANDPSVFNYPGQLIKQKKDA
jgi:hypothetical protein